MYVSGTVPTMTVSATGTLSSTCTVTTSPGMIRYRVTCSARLMRWMVWLTPAERKEL